MNKILFRNIILLVLLSISTYSCRKEEAHPNIIFLFTDDQKDNTFSIDGNIPIKTPNIDKLMQSGIRFQNAYTASPVCCPSRVSVFTGMHERKHMINFTSAYKLTADQWKNSYPALLRKAGYYTGFMGKFGVEYYTFRGHADTLFDYWVGHDGWTRFFPKDTDNESCRPYHNAKEDMITFIMGEYMEKFLRERPEHRPFCLSVSFSVPHLTQCASMHPDVENPRHMLEPANNNPRLKGSPIYDTLYRNSGINIPEECGTDPYIHIPRFILDQDKGRNTTYYQSYYPETNKEHHIRYYQLITGMDVVIGNLVRSLKEQGLDKNTVIIYSSDNGLLMGDYGMGGKSLLYDLTARVPCFIYDPGLDDSQRGQTRNQLVSTVDITSTILDYAGIDQPGEMDGKSLRQLVFDPDSKWRSEMFIESLYTGRDNPFIEGIRKGRWKYLRMYDGVVSYSEEDLDFRNREPKFEQLFDLKADPGEKINLIKEYEGSELLQQLKEKCATESERINRERQLYKQNHITTLR
ncbi:MAG TPA: hypothetical protein DEQ09_06355 [Bacteroidales bacterium]|nr:hypothetical protein [Bacteroidales bacterium]